MAKATFFTRNLLENGIVTVTGDADTGYPESRLHDRAISLYWKDTVTEAKTFQVDQCLSGEAIDFLAIEKHNFSGEAMTWEHSANGSEWTPAVAGWSQNDNDQIIKVLSTPVTAEFWRVSVTSMDNPQCSEIFMSKGHEFKVDFTQNPRAEDEPNVLWIQTVGGLERSTKFGDARKKRIYSLFLDASEIVDFRTVKSDLDGYSKPFYLKDHEGEYWSARFLSAPPDEFITEGNVQTVIECIEML